ncbi:MULTISPECIES: ABC transporter permease DevC [Pseudanabaena]|uniref:DevC protein n=2 Tax=Pseudanabaena TaxID=1152 RepID=L8N4P6_9CYAN|nr:MULTISPECIES: ABC transporter permease DevC [Pseudanabaena]ELS34104.1 DevC protein [Pseudanabaena biceps PCC 7429]MDG3493693.1 ABC transporter permease DevC [Pseudanabaena catenata USMAC16]
MITIQQIQRRTPLGWLQLSRERGRLVVALAGIAFADVLMFMQLGFQSALYDSNTKLSRALDADIVLVSPQARNTQNLSTFSRRRLYQSKDIAGVDSAEAFYSNIITWKNPDSHKETSVQAIAFNPEKPALNLPEINQQLDKIKIPDRVLFDRKSRGDYTKAIAIVEQGRLVQTEVDRRNVLVTGLFSLGASFGADGIVVVSDQTFLHFFPKRDAASISLGLVKVKSGYAPKQVATELKAYLPNDVRVLTHAEYIEFEESFWKNESPIGFIFGLGTAMAFVVGVVIVYQVLSTDVNSHIKEYATFKAMGYRNQYLLAIVFEEAIILAVLGFIPGVIIPIGLYSLAAGATALPIAMTTTRATTVFMLTVAMCVLSGAIATRRLQSADPADMF